MVGIYCIYTVGAVIGGVEVFIHPVGFTVGGVVVYIKYVEVVAEWIVE